MINLNITDIQAKESVREYAYRILKENILNVILIPDTAISEKEISDMLSISRTPVREAFIRLAQEGLLEILPQRGTYVAKIDTQQIEEFKFLRVTLEQAVMKLACEQFPEKYKKELVNCLAEQKQCVKNKDYNYFFQLDNLMHNIIFSGCNKKHVWKIIEETNLNYIRARVLDLSAKEKEIDILFSQHEKLVEAVLEKNSALAYEIITEHVNKVIGDVEELQKAYPLFFK